MSLSPQSKALVIELIAQRRQAIERTLSKGRLTEHALVTIGQGHKKRTKDHWVRQRDLCIQARNELSSGPYG